MPLLCFSLSDSSYKSVLLYRHYPQCWAPVEVARKLALHKHVHNRPTEHAHWMLINYHKLVGSGCYGLKTLLILISFKIYVACFTIL